MLSFGAAFSILLVFIEFWYANIQVFELNYIS